MIVIAVVAGWFALNALAALWIFWPELRNISRKMRTKKGLGREVVHHGQ